MEKIKIIKLSETDSTNRFLREYKGDEGLLMTVATADYQTAGRGQGSNTWESERGQNLLFSVKVYPTGIEAARQYVMLEAGALALYETLSEYVGDITIKWPNDIYWHDMKISGTLSECTVSHNFINNCILGTGVNINQQVFRSGAPNPVSLCQILKRKVSKKEVIDAFLRYFEKNLYMVNEGNCHEIDKAYTAVLYRRTGFFTYEDVTGRFSAEFERIEPNGNLVLRKTDGSQCKYAFKEVKYII